MRSNAPQLFMPLLLLSKLVTDPLIQRGYTAPRSLLEMQLERAECPEARSSCALKCMLSSICRVKCRWNHFHGNVEKSVELSLQNLGPEIGYIDLLLLHCVNPFVMELMLSGPVAFKAEADKVTIARHPDGLVYLSTLNFVLNEAHYRRRKDQRSFRHLEANGSRRRIRKSPLYR
jgi:hypothetical protein